MRGQDKGSRQVQASGSSEAPNKNRFYALHSRVEQETSPDVVISVLKDFPSDVFDLLDPGATQYFVAPLISKKFEILPDILNEPFMVSTPVDESVVAKTVYKN